MKDKILRITDLKDGDIIVIETDKGCTSGLYKRVKKFFKNNKVLVLEHGAKINIYRDI